MPKLGLILPNGETRKAKEKKEKEEEKEKTGRKVEKEVGRLGQETTERTEKEAKAKVEEDTVRNGQQKGDAGGVTNATTRTSISDDRPGGGPRKTRAHPPNRLSRPSSPSTSQDLVKRWTIL